MTRFTVTAVGNEGVPIPPPGWGAVEKWVIEVVTKLSKKYYFNIVSMPSKNRVKISNTNFIYAPNSCNFYRSLSRSFQRHP